MSNTMKFLFAVCCLLLLIGCKKQVLTFEVTSKSMAPTFGPGDFVEAVPFGGTIQELQRFAVVVFHPPSDRHEQLQTGANGVFMFRIWALPGEQVTAEGRELLVDASRTEGKRFRLNAGFESVSAQFAQKMGTVRWSLGSNEVFVLGDNFTNANDSRVWGLLDTSNIAAIVSCKKRPRE